MKILSGLDGLKTLPPGSILSIGNYDGVHRGHQALLAFARDLKARRPAHLAVATFEPHPLTVLRPEKAPPRLTPLDLKRELLASQGVDDLIELAPEPAVLNLSAEAFWRLLRDEARPAFLVEGGEFYFGKGRGGNIAALRDWSAQSDVKLCVVDSVAASLSDGRVVPASSTTTRWLVAYGRMRDAEAILGRPYALRGPVVRGFGRGREFGVPTANLRCDQQFVPDDAVYAGRCEIDGKLWPVAVSIGTMPTLGDYSRQIEAHLIGYGGDLYDRVLTVELLDWLREQRKFPSIDVLKQQMARDIADCVNRFRERGGAFTTGQPHLPVPSAVNA